MALCDHLNNELIEKFILGVFNFDELKKFLIKFHRHLENLCRNVM